MLLRYMLSNVSQKSRTKQPCYGRDDFIRLDIKNPWPKCYFYQPMSTAFGTSIYRPIHCIVHLLSEITVYSFCSKTISPKRIDFIYVRLSWRMNTCDLLHNRAHVCFRLRLFMGHPHQRATVQHATKSHGGVDDFVARCDFVACNFVASAGVDEPQALIVKLHVCDSLRIC